VDSTKRFTSLPSGTCAPIAAAGYQEYIASRDLQRFQTVGSRIVTAIAAVRGRAYTSEASVALYPVTGAQSDYAYGRHIANSAVHKTYGFTFETGPWTGNAADSFHPVDPEPIKRDAKSGLIALMQQCICAIELIGSRFFETDAEVNALRRIRDELLATTDAGRAWIALFERIQQPLTVQLLADEKLLSQAAAIVKRTAELANDDQAPLADTDVDDGLQLLRMLARRTDSPDVRRDLRATERQLGALRGALMANALEMLMSQAPTTRIRK